MEAVTLDAKTRDLSIKAKIYRQQNLIPAELYGKGEKNQQLLVDLQIFTKLYSQAGGNTVVTLQIEGKKTPVKVMIHDLQYNVITDNISHIDFIKVNMKEEVTASVPLEFTGEADGVKNLGGDLHVIRDKVEIKCLPNDLIHSIEVDISPLVDFNISIKVSDLVVTDKVEILTGADETVVTVIEKKEVVEEEPVEAAAEEGAAEEGSKTE